MKKIIFALMLTLSLPVFSATSFNYEMTAQPGTESVRPLAFYDDGKTTYIKLEPVKQQKLTNGEMVPVLPDVFVIGKDGRAIIAPAQKWSAETHILSVQAVSERWLIRSGSKVVGVRKSASGGSK
ncbi:TrbG/VirB9 family P-type conjugative transfer protein [Candidatus Pantoea formicae]|uniref:TrbG/VirB9 family P-type conjugative transfer protein n=1 Tax=Candidatus Pantoea formicae TaxID=2608355 RepID=UPI003ED8B71F